MREITISDVERMSVRLPESAGYCGENGATTIRFDVGDWLTEYPDGVVTLVYARPDGSVYVCDTDILGDVVSWQLTDTDTAYAGEGKAELRITQDGRKVKSSVLRVTVKKSITGESQTVPSTRPDWVETILSAQATAAKFASISATAAPLAAGSAPTAEMTQTADSTAFAFGIPAGASGADGADGADGVGIPDGGTTGQVLIKGSAADYDVAWGDASGGGGSINPNLLINGNSVICQRGRAVSGVKTFTLTAGSASWQYCDDMWRYKLSAGGNATVTWTQGQPGVSVNVTSGTVTRQYVMEAGDWAALAGRTLTVSQSVGGVVTQTTKIANASNFTVTASGHAIAVEQTFAATAAVEWTKLETAAAATAFIPRAEAYELAGAQRYTLAVGAPVMIFTALRYDASATALTFVMPTPVTMRDVPSVEYNGAYDGTGETAAMIAMGTSNAVCDAATISAYGVTSGLLLMTITHPSSMAVGRAGECAMKNILLIFSAAITE